MKVGLGVKDVIWRGAGRIKKDSWKWNRSRKGSDLKGRKDRKIKTGKANSSQKAMIPKVLKDNKRNER
jgi:hypothetical protein